MKNQNLDSGPSNEQHSRGAVGLSCPGSPLPSASPPSTADRRHFRITRLRAVIALNPDENPLLWEHFIYCGCGPQQSFRMCFPAGLGWICRRGQDRCRYSKAHNKVWCLCQTSNILGFVPKDCLLTSAERVQPFVRSREKSFFLAPRGNTLQTREVSEILQMLPAPGSQFLTASIC